MKDQILALLENKDFLAVRKLLDELNKADIAEILEELDTNNMLLTFRLLQKERAVEVFAYLTPLTQEEIVTAATDKEINHLVNELFFDDMIDLLEEMPAYIVKRILTNVKEQDRALVNHFLKYPEYSAGSLMTIEFVDLKKDKTVKEALAEIRKTGLEKETIYTCYIIDSARKLEGTVSLRQLVTSDEHKRIEEIMRLDPIYVHTHDDQEEIAKMFKKYDLIAMPVVDKEHRLVGIITVDDIIDVIEEETTEDIYKMAAMSPTEEEYLNTSVFKLAKHRLTWLLFLMISATFTGLIINKYENALKAYVILASFIPMIMDTGGNAGSQSATLVIRGLALSEIKTKDYLKVIIKELLVSLVAGFILASVNFGRIMIFDRDYKVALTVSLTMFVTVILAKVTGGILPIAANKLKLDPAIMASPLITTIVDALALIVYFTLATNILGI